MIASDLDHLTPLPKQDLTSDELKSTIAGRNISSSAMTELQPKRSFGRIAHESVCTEQSSILLYMSTYHRSQDCLSAYKMDIPVVAGRM
jgi:hypothetical protein